MLHASTRKLIDRLAEMTDLSKLDWTESDDGQISYSTEGYSVSLTESPNEVVITSIDGKELERASAEDLAATQDDAGQSYTAIVASMTAEASRIARGTERAISSILAGMEDTPTDQPDASSTHSDPVDAAQDDTPLEEDPVDDTNAVAADSIEVIEADPEPEAAETVIEASDEDPSDDPGEEDPAETEDAIIVETAAEDEDTETVEETAIDADVAEAESDLELAPSAETETEVTEAVARLADEVNEREDSRLDEAAASAVGAVALAAGLTSSNDEDDEPETETRLDASDAEPELEITPEPDPQSDTEEATEPAATPVVADSNIAMPYVPFGLEEQSTPEATSEDDTAIIVASETQDPEPEPEPMPAMEPAEIEDTAPGEQETSPEVSEDVIPEVASFEDSLTNDAEDTIETEPLEDPAPEQIAADEETDVESTIVPFTPLTAAELPSDDVATGADDAVIEALETEAPVTFETESDLDIEVESTATETVQVIAEPDAQSEAPVLTSTPLGFTETTLSTASAPDEADMTETSAPAIEAAAPSASDETLSDITPDAAPQSYSLSGIGAGFGLGALSAKTEATGVPGPSAALDADKVVIDATDDVLPPIKGKLNLPPSLTEPASAQEPT